MKTLALLALVIWGNFSQARPTKQVPFNITGGVDAYLKGSEVSGLDLTTLEKQVKGDLLYLRIVQPDRFKDRKKESLAESETYQSYIYEVEDAIRELAVKNTDLRRRAGLGASKAPTRIQIYERLMRGTAIDKARRVAKKKIYELFLANRKAVMESLAELAIDDSNGYRSELIRYINERLVLDLQHSRKGYLFKFGEWGYVEISYKLAQGRSIFSIDNRLDTNRLESGAERLRADDDWSREPVTKGPTESAPDEAEPLAPSPFDGNFEEF
ncbi:MAG: hypothetical protein IT289_00175 [Oligoflexia bacterium]|nr:hypothetical protein [Oligoflexia bacterium]